MDNNPTAAAERVREAADRLRAMRKASDEHDGGYPDNDEGRSQSRWDHVTLADAYLAQQPTYEQQAVEIAELRAKLEAAEKEREAIRAALAKAAN